MSGAAKPILTTDLKPISSRNQRANDGGLRCPDCRGLRSGCIDTRTIWNGDAVRRRRSCMLCGYRWTTYEAAKPRVIAGMDPGAVIEMVGDLQTRLDRIVDYLRGGHE